MKHEVGDGAVSRHPDDPTRFLIVRTDRLGDVILTLPMASAIKAAIPASRVLFLARAYTKPIVEDAPDVDDILVAGDGASLRELIRTFRSARADVAFFPSPRFRLALAAFLSRIPIRIGTGYRWYSFLFNRRVYEHRHTAERHEAEYNLRMLSAVGISAKGSELPRVTLRKDEKESADSWIASQIGNEKFAVLHSSIGGFSKPWPAERFAQLGRQIGDRSGMTIILTGLRQDAAVLHALAAQIGEGRARVFMDHTLPELAALLARAEIVVAASTGPGHLAAALGTRTIGLFPLTRALSKERWGFRGNRVWNLSPYPLPSCPDCEDCTCMERLDVESVRNHVVKAMDA